MMNHNSTEYQIFRLTGNFSETVRDPLWRDIPLSCGFKTLFTSAPMQKLGRIRQLGPAHLLYPGAVHTRADHSLGVFHVTRLIILALLGGSSGRGIIPDFTHEDIQAMLAAAMLHDLGHFPYAHALKDIVSKEHESLGAAMIMDDAILRNIIENRLETSVEKVCQIIDPSLPCENTVIQFFRTILSGTLDPDKLDYLSRDALFCGIPYGMQDSSYIIRHLAVTERMVLAVPFEAIGAVEHLLFAKYAMYRNVYWHHVTRGATAMIKKAILIGMRDRQFSEEDLYDLDDESFARLFTTDPGSPSSSLFRRVREHDLLQCRASAQVEDGTVLATEMKQDLETQIFEHVRRTCEGLEKHEVIIDIPEQVSFESDIPMLMDDGSCRPFHAVDELFTPPVVRAFVNSLRKVRLYLPAHVEERLARNALEGALSNHG